MDINQMLKALPTTPCYDSREFDRRNAEKVLRFIKQADPSAALAVVGEWTGSEPGQGEYIERWRVETSDGPTRDLMNVPIVQV